MFRKMRRFKQQFSQEDCFEILETEKRGVLALHGDDDYPYAIPINFYYDKDENKIYFHGAGEGHKIDSIKRSEKASFCVYTSGTKDEGQWWYRVKSVIVFGKIKIISDREKAIEAVTNIGIKYFPNKSILDEELKNYADKVTCLEMSIEHITGKNVKEK